MKELDFSKLRFGCSKVGLISKQNKKLELSEIEVQTLTSLRIKQILTATEQKRHDKLLAKLEMPDTDKFPLTATSYLKFLYLVKRYGSFYNIKGGAGIAQMMRGTKSEPSSVILLSEYYQQSFYKQKTKITNDKFSGRLDITDGSTIETSSKIIDIKTTFSLLGFTKKINAPLSEMDNLQMQAYFDITGKDYGEICYCLSDFPPDMIEQQKDILIKQLCPDGVLTDEFLEIWAKAYNSLTYKHIPVQQRVIIEKVHRDNQIIADIREKVDICREWLENFHKMHTRFFDEQYYQKDYS